MGRVRGKGSEVVEVVGGEDGGKGGSKGSNGGMVEGGRQERQQE